MKNVNRRDFVQSLAASGAAIAVGTTTGSASAMSTDGNVAPGSASLHNDASSSSKQSRTFKLKYAPHFGMFTAHAGNDLVAQLEFMASEGFTAFEDNDLKGRSLADQERIGNTLARLNMTMGVFVAHTIDWSEPGLPSGKQEKTDRFLKELAESVEVAKRVNAKWMTVVPGVQDPRRDRDYQMASLVETLRRGAAILEPHGLVMVLEMLNTRRNHPGQFLTHTAQGHLICTAVNSPSCKLLYDMYHQQITEGNIIPNMNDAWESIGYLQVGDNPGRNEPGTGEMDYRNIFRNARARGFKGVIGMEHGNSIRASRDAADAAAVNKRGERAVIDAYIHADSF